MKAIAEVPVALAATDIEGEGVVSLPVEKFHKVTLRTEGLVFALGRLASEIEGGLLAAASFRARQEWWEQRRRWPTEDDMRAGVIGMSDDELMFVVQKVHRFKTILTILLAGPSEVLPIS